MNFEWRRFKKSWMFIILAFFLGIILICFSYFDEAILTSPKWRGILRLAGQTILSSSVFLGIVKTFQYTDYFKDEINEVIFTGEYLKKLHLDALKEKWIILTNVLHTTAFPSLKNNLNVHLLDRIISSHKNYTHSRMYITYTITPLGDDMRFFKLIEKVKMRINSTQEKKTDFTIRTNIVKEDNAEDKSAIKLTKLIIDDEDHLQKVPAPNEVSFNGQKKIKIDYSHTVFSKSSFPVVKELETIHSTMLNAYWRADFDTFVEDGLEIVLHYDKEIFEVDLLSVGQTITLEKDNFDDHTEKYTCNHLIFQQDCLILIIKYKEK